VDLQPYEQTATRAAYQAAKILRSRFGKTSRIWQKTAAEIVTEADTESEEQIISSIHARYPDHAILGEECGLIAGESEFKWIIDPLDGTVNFAHQVPFFAISLALAIGDAVVLGIVLNPVSGELFCAVRHRGARLNGQPIGVSSVSMMARSLLVTGFPYNLGDVFDPVMLRYGNCLKAVQGVRRLGSAALDLCYVACGRFEGFWEQSLKPWDTAAGALIVAEAGGKVTTFSNLCYTVDHPEILATNGHIHHQMIALLKL
jgi:myo-inositol-1(or 4)-monophosphatase